MRSSGRRAAVAATSGLLAICLVTVAATNTAQAAVTVSRAEVSATRLRIEGSAAPQRPITVDGVTMTTSSSSGSFKVERSGYTRPADCTVDVGDGTGTPLNVRLSGCTVTATTTTTTTTTTAATTTTVAPPSLVAIDSVTVSPSSLQGGATASATVTLSGPAPSGGAVVSLTSSDAAVAVPSTVTVPQGASSAVVVISTSPVTTTTSSTISASYQGITRSTTITVTPPEAVPPPAIESVVLDPAVVQTGTTSTSVWLYFTGATPAGGAQVTLASSDRTRVTVPASILVPANSSASLFSATISSTAAAGNVTISATYDGVTRSATLTISATTLFRIITASPLPNARVGADYAGFIEACCGQGTPYTWSLVSGTVPDGLRFAGNDLRLSRTTGVTGVPTRVQTTTFTVRARDSVGNTATKTFTLTVDPAAPLIVNNGTDVLPSGRVGVAYETGLFPLGGTPPWRWSHVAGTLPPGLRVQASPGRVLGTPTTPGTFTFTVRVDDSAGQFATQRFTITITS